MRHLRAHCEIAWQAIHRFFVDHGPEHAGNMAFLGMLALLPFLMFLLSLSGLAGQTEAGQAAIDFLLSNLPPRAAAAIGPPLQSIVSAADGRILAVAVLFALYTSVTGVEAARQAVIHAYGSWQHAAPLWRRILADLVVIAVIALAFTVATALIVLLPPAIDSLERVVDLPDIVHEYSLWSRYLLAPVILFTSLLSLYRIFAPRMPDQRRFYLPGALLTAAVWMILGKAMALYVRGAGRYDAVYGSLAGVVILLLFLFFVSATFILGAHLNAAYSRTRGCAPARRD